jgi:RNA polymerase sigma-70 factor, ECF subfamily
MVTHSRAEEFLLLYSGCEGWLLAYLMALLGNRDDAEEVFQETTLALWRSFEEFIPGSDFTRWAKRVAFHRVLTFRKKRRRQGIPHSEQFLEAVHSADERQATTVTSRLRALDDCVRRLPESDRRLVSLRYTTKQTIPQLATNLGRSASTITKALRRIRRVLMSCIDRTLASESSV